jgi:SAM-dependent methyltransferase
MLKRPYRPQHDQNRMRHEGDVTRARQEYFAGRVSANLRHLLAGRYGWMNDFIGPADVGVEVGCGTGLSREFIRAGKYYLSDLADYDWLDFKHVNALATPFAAESFDFVVSSNMIHHVPSPPVFFDEMWRILRPGGRLLIQEINASLLMRMLLRAMRHEGYSFDVDVFDRQAICTDPNDLWSANCAIPNLLFDDLAAFQRQVPGFRPVVHCYSECLGMVNSGGVIAKTIYIPLPNWMLSLVRLTDRLLTCAAPQLLAMQRQIVLEKGAVQSPAPVTPLKAVRRKGQLTTSAA